jgi:hypothetical protein
MSDQVEIPKPARKSKKAAVEVVAPTEISSVVVEEAVENTENNVINPNPRVVKRIPKSNTRANNDGVVSSFAADIALQKFVVEEVKETVSIPEDKIALWSERNIRWEEVGSISTGYNIVTKEVADKWLTLRGIRVATPEEVATYYGK